MEGKKVPKVLWFVGIFVLIVAISGLIVGLVIYFKNKSSDADNRNAELSPAWGYTCEKNVCKKMQLTPENIGTSVSLSVCRMFCNEDVGTVWPKPTGKVIIDNNVVKINQNGITFKTENFIKWPAYWEMAKTRFLEMQKKKLPKNMSLKSGGKNFEIEVVVEVDDMAFTLETKEGYTLKITDKGDEGVHALVTATNFFGARNGLETLSQLIVYDNIRNEIVVVGSAEIEDSPKYKYRGILLDTARNYFSVDSIRRTIEGMAMVKLNTFHWHITDTHSFPFVMKSRPELSRLGAYSADKVYTQEDISDVVKFGLARGVRVLPEFDAPAHVGEGWQNKDLTTCFNAQPWKDFCVEPPCGQLDPSKDEVYNVLEDIYREMVEYFGYPDIFHMGGDEVSTSCWNSSKSLQDWMVGKGWGLEEADFMKLWDHFQTSALDRLDKVNFKKVPIIMWTSTLTDEPYLSQYLDKDRYIIQVWTKGDDPKIQTLLQNGYKLIISTYDTLYLDCGFAGWVTDGHNWCSPYSGWQKIYDHRLDLIEGPYTGQIYGAEAALWTEQADEFALDSRVWPRASAMAERLWTDPPMTSGWRNAESRMLINRLRLVEIGGIAADRLQPEWCLQNEGECPV